MILSRCCYKSSFISVLTFLFILILLSFIIVPYLAMSSMFKGSLSIKQLCATERNPKLGNKEGSGFGDFPSMCAFASWVVMCGWGCMVLCVCEVGIERPLGLWYEKQWHYSIVYTTLPLFAITTAVYTAFVWTTAPLQGRDCCRLHCCHPYCHLPSQSF